MKSVFDKIEINEWIVVLMLKNIEWKEPRGYVRYQESASSSESTCPSRSYKFSSTSMDSSNTKQARRHYHF